jgi:predicted RND superfamily exporter protein
MARGASKHDAILESMRINFHPVFLTSLTTAIGFLSLNFSDAPPFRDLGNITAIGVIAAWAYSVFFLPALMSILPMRAKPHDLSAITHMERLANFVIARRRPLLWGVSSMVVLLGIMIPRIELNDQFVNYFDPVIQFRADIDFAMKNLSGIYQVQYSLPAGESGGISEPAYLQEVDDFANWLRSRPEVVHVQAYTDIVRRLNKNMHGDDPAWYLLPDIRELAAQYLLLFEMSLPYGLDLNNQINVDKSSVRIIATLKNITTRESRVLKAASESWLKKNMVSAAEIEGSGPFVMFAYISERNIKSMLVGTSLAFVLISLSLVVALRHIRLGLLSLIPNLVPAVIVFGVWAIAVGELGLAASVVVATSLGIIVDDTVHFLSKYLRARREQGLNSEDAVRYAFATVGTALVVTSIILVAGFGVLAFSAFELNQSLGLLTAASIAAALFVDFTLLPALLVALSRGRTNSKEKDHG